MLFSPLALATGATQQKSGDSLAAIPASDSTTRKLACSVGSSSPFGFSGQRRSRFALDGCHHQFAIMSVDVNGAAQLERASQDAIRQPILDHVGDHTAQRTGTELRVVTLLAEQQLGVLGHVQNQRVLSQPLTDLVQ